MAHSHNTEIESAPDLTSDAEADSTELPTATQPWRILFGFATLPDYFLLLTCMILAVVSGAILPVLSIFLGKIFEQFTDIGSLTSGGRTLHEIGQYTIALCGLGALTGILNCGFYAAWLSLGERQAKRARDLLFETMLERDIWWYDQRKIGVGTLVTRYQAQIEDLRLALSQPLGFAIQYSCSSLVAIGIALYFSWQLTLVTIATIPLSTLLLGWINRQIPPAVAMQNNALTEVATLSRAAFSGIESVKCVNAQDHELNQFATALKSAAAFYRILIRGNAAQIGIVRFVTLGMFVQGFWYGSHLATTGAKTPGDIVTPFWATLMAMQSAEQILPQLIVLQKGRTAATSLKRMLSTVQPHERSMSKEGYKRPEYCDGDIEVRNLSFSYPSNSCRTSLSDVSFFFPAGETTFLVGKSGSGKSTLASLLVRFYEPQEGKIWIDGHALKDLSPSWLRNNMTLISQNSELFDDSVLRNIALGHSNPDTISPQDLLGPIKVACLQNTILILPHGLESQVGSGGNTLSGGQKQRVAIARAYLRDTPILILDEATSALDQNTRALVHESIRNWRKGKTTIIITHDLTQVCDRDYVYALEGGKIAHEGYKHVLERSATQIFATQSEEKESLPPCLPSSLVDRGLDAQLRRIGHCVSRRSASAPPPKSVANIVSSNTSNEHSEKSRLSYRPPLPEKDAKVLCFTRSDHFQSRLNDAIHVSSASDKGNHYKKPETDEKHDKCANSVDRQNDTSRDDQDPASSSDFRGMKPVFGSIWESASFRGRCLLLGGFVCATAHALSTPLFSWVFAKVLGTFTMNDPAQRSHETIRWSLSVLGIAFGDGLTTFGMHYLLQRCSQTWVDYLRIKAIRRILDQPLSWFRQDGNSPGRLTACLDQNAEEVRYILGRFAAFIYVAALMLIVTTVWSLAVCWRLTLVGLATSPALYAMTRGFQRVSAVWERKCHQKALRVSSISGEVLGNIRFVRAYTLEGYFHDKHVQATHEAFKTGLRRALFSGMFFGLSETAILFVTALILWYGAFLVSHNTESVDIVLTVFALMLFGMANINVVMAYIPQINRSRSVATKLLELGQLPYQRSFEHTGKLRLRNVATVQCHNLSFTYPRTPSPVLRSLDLSISAGQSLAIVGTSGCGKSTLASLLVGLYPPTSTTSITVNNVHALSDLHLPTLRTQIVLVAQLTTLFPASIADNIAYGIAPESSPTFTPSLIQRIETAAKQAGIHDFITTHLPNGYATRVGPGGTGLSGGQTTRLGLARALLRDPDVLLLDEVTANLDWESAQAVREMVSERTKKGKAVVCVTHDRIMMEGCDGVVVLRGGRVVESGAFKDLLADGKELRKVLGEV